MFIDKHSYIKLIKLKCKYKKLTILDILFVKLLLLSKPFFKAKINIKINNFLYTKLKNRKFKLCEMYNFLSNKIKKKYGIIKLKLFCLQKINNLINKNDVVKIKKYRKYLYYYQFI